MSLRCDNCGEPALDTDAVCWHCGKPLPGREGADIPKVQVKEGWQRATSSAAFPMYLLMTILVILATLVVMSALGRQPLIQVGFGTRTPSNWIQVTSSDKTFILNLPEDWLWLDRTEPAQQSAFAERVDDNKLVKIGTYPFGAEVEDMDIQFLAEFEPEVNDSMVAFLVVAKSAILNQLTHDEVVEFLLNSEYMVSEATFVDDFDKRHVSIVTRTEFDNDPLDSIHCHQQFILGDKESMLVSICSTADQYETYMSTFDTILGSFQRLDS